MKKTLLFCLSALLLPFITLAQDKNPPIFDDFAKGIKASNAFAFDEHLNIMQLTTDDDKFDLVAINDKMQQVWKISLNGYGIKTDKFKNKIVALASADHSSMKGTNNTFKAYVIDPATGKVLADKIVYQSTDEFVEYPQMYTAEGSFFKLAVRKTAFKRKIHVVVPIVSLFSGNSFARELNETKDLQVISYNDQLDSISSFKPAKSNGTFISMAWNKHADMFIGWLNGPSIEVYKYDAGKTTPSNQMTVPVAFKEDRSMVPGNLLFLQPAENRDLLYYSTIYTNTDKDPELGVGKLDFGSGKKSYVTQVLDKANLKALKKSFVPVNKDVDDVDFGMISGMRIKYMTETGGKVIIATAADSYNSSSSGTTSFEGSLLLNGYDKDLTLKYQRILPANSSFPGPTLITGFHVNNNKLCIIANAHQGLRTNVCIYGMLDIGTGNWDKVQELSKKHLDNDGHSKGPSVLWFGDGFILPYFTPKGLMQSKYNTTLQQNQY